MGLTKELGSLNHVVSSLAGREPLLRRVFEKGVEVV